ncbi:MAG: aspartate aminotransferase family protein [Candidatus Eisenbacteria bacterium]|nr:aspartate aminotransferase family protein [Candidatus Eisenbacteria bacterium]
MPMSMVPDTRHAPLAMSQDEFRRIGHQLVDQIADQLAAIPAGPVTRERTPAGIREALGLNGPMPAHGSAAGAILERAVPALFANSLFNGHPRFWGYITSSPAPIGILGDLLAASLNPNVGSWTLSPAGTEVESTTVRWIAELIGYPGDAGGVLVSGGNMANMVGFWAARAARSGGDVRAEGVAGRGALRVYTSAETHTWVQKACDLSGLGTQAIRWIPTCDDLTMDVAALRQQVDADIAAGERPLMIIGTAGSVSTGAIDALDEIGAFCRERGIWFHVDGAYGGFAAALPESSAALRALALADSVAVDPHKWLYAPLEAGCALVRDREVLRAAFSYHPAYYHFAEQVTNFVDFGPQNSRGFRALKVWLALQHAGVEGYRTMIRDDIALSEHLATLVRGDDRFEFYTQGLSITTFRYVPRDLRATIGDEATEKHLDALNRELLDTLQKGGELFVSNAVIRGRYVLRACIVNFHTSKADIEAVPGVVARVAEAIDRKLRA